MMNQNMIDLKKGDYIKFTGCIIITNPITGKKNSVQTTDYYYVTKAPVIDICGSITTNFSCCECIRHLIEEEDGIYDGPCHYFVLEPDLKKKIKIGKSWDFKITSNEIYVY